MNAFAPTSADDAVETHARRRARVTEEQPAMVAERSTAVAERVQLALGLVAIVAALLLVTLGVLNRSLQAEAAAGQAKIAAAQTAATVNNNLIRLLAKAAAEKGDERIRDLLARNGITYRPATPAAPAATEETKP